MEKDEEVVEEVGKEVMKEQVEDGRGGEGRIWGGE